MNILKLLSGPTFPLLGILLVIQIRSDGYFPLPRDLPESWIITIVMLHTLFLAVCVSRSIYLLISEKDCPVIDNQKIVGISISVVPILALLGICGIHILQANTFSAFDYKMDLFALFTYFLLSLIPLGTYWFYVRNKKTHSVYLFLICILVSSFIVQIFPLEYFPVDFKRSDMLPIIKEAATRILEGQENIYLHEFGSGFQYINIRPPGLIIAYLPAVAFDFDLRIISIIFNGLTLLLLFWVVRSGEKRIASALKKIPLEIVLPLVSLILLPYWHFRHELYEPPLWFLLFLTLLALESKFYMGFIIGLSALVVTHQWGWILGPFLAIAFIKQKGWSSAVPGLLAVFIIGVTTFSLFISGIDHFVSIFLMTPNVSYFYPLSMNMNSIFFKFNLQSYSQIIGGILQIPLLVLAFKHGHKMDALCGILAGSLTIILFFNLGPSWTYQYLLVSFLLISGFVFRYKSSHDVKIYTSTV